MTDILSETSPSDLVGFIKRNIIRELYEAYPSIQVVEGFMAALVNAAEAAGNLMEYISFDFDGLSRTIAELIGGVEVEVDTKGFANDPVTFKNKDDVLTLLIHLGYLAYDEEQKKAYIPNEEIRMESARVVRTMKT